MRSYTTSPTAAAGPVWLILLCAGYAVLGQEQDCNPDRICRLDPAVVSPIAAPWSAAAADLDGDADLDLVSANAETDNLTVFFFQKETQKFELDPEGPLGDFSTTAGPRAVAIGDLDSDDLLDLVSANFTGSNLTIFFQFRKNPDDVPQFILDPGGPLPSSESALGTVAVAAADVDGDGDLDLLAANHDSSTISIFVNEGGGAYAPPVDVGTGLGPSALAVADIDGDQSLDLVTVNDGDDTLTVLLNSGTGSFIPTVSLQVGSGPQDVALADLDGDGDIDHIDDIDVVTANHDSNSVSVLLNRGISNGAWQGFEARVDYPIAMGPTSVAAVALDAGNTLDIAVACRDQGILQVRPGALEDCGYRLKAPLSFVLGSQNPPAKPRFVRAAGPAENLLLVVGDSPGEISLLHYETPSIPLIEKSGDVNNNHCPDDSELDCNGNDLPDGYDIQHGISKDENGDGIPDDCWFHRGDPNSSGAMDLSDAVFVLHFLFLGEPAPTCKDSADANDDGELDIADPINILAALFLGGRPIPDPGPPGGTCGPDPPGSSLGCVSYSGCEQPPACTPGG